MNGNKGQEVKATKAMISKNNGFTHVEVIWFIRNGSTTFWEVENIWIIWMITNLKNQWNCNFQDIILSVKYEKLLI